MDVVAHEFETFDAQKLFEITAQEFEKCVGDAVHITVHITLDELVSRHYPIQSSPLTKCPPKDIENLRRYYGGVKMIDYGNVRDQNLVKQNNEVLLESLM